MYTPFSRAMRPTGENKWRSVLVTAARKAEIMPVLLLWAIPAVLVIGGGTYLLFLK
jgi:hypothetical protein